MPHQKGARPGAGHGGRQHRLARTYRRLASLLHPDREQDPEERQRKKALMQQANTAYEKRDLMGLLRLQMQCAQLDVDALGELPEARIQRYNEAIRQQVATLKRERQALIQAASELLDVDERILEHVVDEGLDAQFDVRMEELEKTIRHVQGLNRDLDSSALRDRAIKRILAEVDAMGNVGDDFGDLDLDELFFDDLDFAFQEDDAPPPPTPPKVKRRKKRKR